MKSTCVVAMASSLLLVATAARPQPIEIGQRLTIRSAILNEDRPIFVHTPPGHAAGRDSYPVLYVIDGETQFTHTAATVDFLARAGRGPDFIVVGILNTDRGRDLTPTHAAARASGLENSGGADKFLSFIESELVPHIEKTYRGAPYRVLAGHSLGGLFAVYALFARPQLFNASIAASPSLFWDGEVVPKRAREVLASRTEFPKTLFLTVGSEPPFMTEPFGRLEAALEQVRVKGFTWEAVRLADEDHGSIVLRSHYAGLRKIFEGWQPSFEEGADGLTKHYDAWSQRLGCKVRPTEAIVNAAGYVAMQRGKLPQAIELFELNVLSHPDSANAHDSLGEGLQAAGKLEQALANYERAVALAEKTKDPNLTVFARHRDEVRAGLKGGGEARP